MMIVCPNCGDTPNGVWRRPYLEIDPAQGEVILCGECAKEWRLHYEDKGHVFDHDAIREYNTGKRNEVSLD